MKGRSCFFQIGELDDIILLSILQGFPNFGNDCIHNHSETLQVSTFFASYALLVVHRPGVLCFVVSF